MVDGKDPATIRDLARLQELFAIQIAEIKNLRAVDREAAQKALEIATAELARRMEALNHEAARIREIENKTITREAHGLTLAPLEKRVGALETEAATLRGKADQRSVNLSFLISAVGLILAVVSLAVRFTS